MRWAKSKTSAPGRRWSSWSATRMKRCAWRSSKPWGASAVRMRARRCSLQPRTPKTRSAKPQTARSKSSKDPRPTRSTSRTPSVDGHRRRDGRWYLATGQDLVPEMARREVIRLDFEQLGLFFLAQVLGKRAAWMEAAARRWVDRAGHVAGQDDALASAFDGWIRNWHGRQQGLGIRVQRPFVQ